MKTFEEYEKHFKSPIGYVVPKSDVNVIINEFLEEGAMNMGSELKRPQVDRIIEIATTAFKDVPVYVLCASIIQGSLGRYGPGRLVPRTVYGWFTEASTEFRSRAKYEEQKKPQERVELPDLIKYPVGKAINLKIMWLTSGAMTSEEWDKIPLWELAERIGKGENPSMRDFGLDPRPARPAENLGMTLISRRPRYE